MSKAAFRLVAVAVLSIGTTGVILVAFRPQAAFSDAGILQNAVLLVSNAESRSGPAIVPYSIAQTEDNFILIKFSFGEGIVQYKPPEGPG
jgi:hypothetical protein